ncbi:MAG: tRNA uridine-5-carboxymethylaminomethyl(34) synthesis GTPase MnmE [Clostridia bacterium]|nr:tRNA uridine-5-carboxymethylaminomethyl(34) synthesis GTPase MnmE [Clostridia bacterium]
MSDTICAISTARGKGGVAMIRISGPDALSTLRRAFVAFSKGDFEPEPRKCYYGQILRDGVPIDDVTATYYKAPASYTGEDVCEICCHGGIYVTQAVLEVALSSGARLAEAGEFTRRAYINGKLSLSRAEAVGQIIDATNDAQLRLSSATRRGTLSKKLDEIKGIMLDLIARAYVVVDYPDEDLPSLERGAMIESLSLARDELYKLKKSYRAGLAVCEGVKTAIVGRPNAGKSSLYNALSGEELDIVTDIAGTTRDVIEHTVSVGDVTLRLADTAGIRDTADEVEKIGVERARERLDTAELVLCVFDASEVESSEDWELLSQIEGRSAVAIINKTDKQRKMSTALEDEIKKRIKRVVYMSAKAEKGIDELGRVLNEMYALDEIDLSSDAVISNARQASSVNTALQKIEEACAFLEMGQSPDIVCFSLESALSCLEMIDARAVSEEIVSQIFSRFCVGK